MSISNLQESVKRGHMHTRSVGTALYVVLMITRLSTESNLISGLIFPSKVGAAPAVDFHGGGVVAVDNGGGRVSVRQARRWPVLQVACAHLRGTYADAEAS